ncbi:hypothetical protein SADUNF_Sadunf14G0104300 [Salix dunnii]|uniref:Uncharacterized protein n=1 Tax=Salix dunnii TaxID=1413687 RepID=A0A835JF12_9ROSI|nr:hypothetical protein SADUNF_Sadunf14G0104300 [Salix dunnii]
MKKNSSSSSISFCPKAVCKKIYKAVRRISSRPQDPSPTSPTPYSSPPPPPPPLSKKIIDIQPQTFSPKTKRHGTPRNREAAETAPVNYDFSSQSIPANGKSKPATPLPPIPNTTEVASRIPEPEVKKSSKAVVQIPSQGDKANHPKFEAPQHNEPGEGNNKQGTHIEERFADYINRARIKIRSLSNAGHEKQHASPGKDKFTDYINRAKVKLRTTSSFGGGKS